MKLLEYPSREVMFERFAALVAGQLRDCLIAKGQATLAVPGGTTPAPFFKALRQVDLGWENVRVMLGDERFVPETSERSNTRLLRETLLQDFAAAAQLVPMRADGETPEDVMVALTLGVEAVLPLDVCVLGMGADMHTASLFPEADQLELALSDAAPVLLPMRAAGAPEPRITVTAPVLKAAGFVHILMTGVEKRAAIEQAQLTPSEMLAPVKVVLDRATVHYAE